MVKIVEFDESLLTDWLKGRPQIIHDMVAKCPPGRLYLLKTTGQRVTVQSYSEDGTVTVNVSGEYNLVMYEKNVFGIKPDDLEECDVPTGEALGNVLVQDADIDAYIDSQIAVMHERGMKHNTARCSLCLSKT